MEPSEGQTDGKDIAEKENPPTTPRLLCLSHLTAISLSLTLSLSPIAKAGLTKTHCVKTHWHIHCPLSTHTHPSHTSMHSTHSCFNKKGLTQSTVAIKASADYSPRRCRDSGPEEAGSSLQTGLICLQSVSRWLQMCSGNALSCGRISIEPITFLPWSDRID